MFGSLREINSSHLSSSSGRRADLKTQLNSLSFVDRLFGISGGCRANCKLSEIDLNSEHQQREILKERGKKKIERKEREKEREKGEGKPASNSDYKVPVFVAHKDQHSWLLL